MNTSFKNRLFSLLLCAALILGFFPTFPISAKASGEINLGTPAETGVGTGQYQYTGATVATDDYYSVSIEVDSGSFALEPTTLPTGTFAGLDTASAYTFDAGDTLTYMVYTFPSGTPANASDLQAFLRDITFTPAAGTDQKVTVTADIVPLKDLTDTYELTRFKDSYYALVNKVST